MTVRARGGIGEMRDRIELFAKARAPEGEASMKETLTPLGKVWTKVTQQSGTRFLDQATAGKEGGQGFTHVFTIRNRPGQPLPDVNTLVFYRGRRFAVKNVRELDQRRDYMDLQCEPEQLQAVPGVDNVVIEDLDG